MKIELQLIRQLSILVSVSPSYEDMQKEILGLLGSYVSANSILADRKGKVWVQYLHSDSSSNTTLPMQADGVYLEPRLFSRLIQLGKGELSLQDNFQVLIIETEINSGDILLLYREGSSFSEEEWALSELCLPTLTLIQRLRKDKEQADQKRQLQLIKSAINTLSFTELEVIVRVFEALGGAEGILIAGKIADGLGVTRSIVVSALRKLESARIIETRSLGVKGTYIRVLNLLWMKELNKLKG